MTLKDLKKKAKATRGQVIKRDDGNYKLFYPTIIDTSKWTLPEEMLAIKDSVNENTEQVTIHGIIRKREDIPTHISRHVSFNVTKAFKRWIGDMYRTMMKDGYKLKVLEAQKDLPRDTKYKKGKSTTYVSGLKCYICNKPCLQSWSTWKLGRKATCTRKCMDAGMEYKNAIKHHKGKTWYSNPKFTKNSTGYIGANRISPITGEKKRYLEHHYNWEIHYNKPVKKGNVLHHIDMCKSSNDVTNLIECNPKDHQAMHYSYNLICKELMDNNIINFNRETKEYYLINKETNESSRQKKKYYA